MVTKPRLRAETLALVRDAQTLARELTYARSRTKRIRNKRKTLSQDALIRRAIWREYHALIRHAQALGIDHKAVISAGRRARGEPEWDQIERDRAQVWGE